MKVLRRLARWLHAQDGAVAVTFAVSVPAIAMLAMGGIELGFLVADKTRLQSVADAAALAGAQELTLSQTQGATTRAEQFALSQLDDVAKRSTLGATATVSADSSSMTVALTADRPSFFGSLLPPGGFHLKVSATAMKANRTPLCVLAHGDKLGRSIEMKDQATIVAPLCLIHANADMKIAAGAKLSAYSVQAVGHVDGVTTPEAEEGAAVVPDPFGSVNVSFPNKCLGKYPKLLSLNGGIYLTDVAIALLDPALGTTGPGEFTLKPGVHCVNMGLVNAAKLTLLPGDHYFLGDLTVADTSIVTGKDVAVVFAKDSKFTFKDQSQVTLDGRKSGALAGFVLATTRDNTADFTISSDHVTSLVGTLYLPNAKLHVVGAMDVAKASDWTVVVAKNIALDKQPKLYINADYEGSDVPVPKGVGPRQGGAVLTQ